MVKPGTPEWDELVDEGWVLSKDELLALELADRETRTRNTSDGGQAGGKENREFEPPTSGDELESLEGEAVERLRREQGLPPTLAKKGKPHNVMVRLTDEAHDGLRSISASFGWVHGGEGNVTALIEAIGTGKLVVRHPEDEVWSKYHRDNCIGSVGGPGCVCP